MPDCPACGATGEGRFCAGCGQSLQQHCERCGEAAGPTDRYCGHCGAMLVLETTVGSVSDSVSSRCATSTAIGDIGLVRGDVTVSSHIGAQIHLGSGSTVNLGSGDSASAASELRRKARALLTAGQYALARDTLRRAIEADPDSAEAHFLLALSRIKARRPKLMPLDEVKAVERDLQTAVHLGDRSNVSRCCWAVVRDDYYRGNSMRVPAPSPEELMAAASLGDGDADELRFMLLHVRSGDSCIAHTVRHLSGAE